MSVLGPERFTKCLRLLTRPRAGHALRFGVFPSLEHVKVPFRTPSTVLDVGASRGQFAAFARWRWPQARILCFEPVEGAVSKLDQMARAFRLEVNQYALGSRDDHAQMYIAIADDSSSLLPAADRLLEDHPEAGLSAIAEVSRRRLDSLMLNLERPCLLKIDVQGSEYDVLLGASDLLRSVDQAYVECSFVELYREQALAADVVSLLQGHGFEFDGVFNLVRDRTGQQVQGDFLFSRRDPGRDPRHGRPYVQ